MSDSSHDRDHEFHLVNPSPWPLMTAMSALLLAVGAILYMHKYRFGGVVLPAGILALCACVTVWWRDVIKEGLVDHAHSTAVRQGLRVGMALFILSEVMFFFVFFWSFFKASLDPVSTLEGVWPLKTSTWPPEGIKTFDPWHLPFMNTLILLLSGTTVTWAHQALHEHNFKDMVQALGWTVLLGISFTILQAIEYHHAPFSINEGIYPSNFYLATGFHGFHVIIGTIFLIVCYFRAKRGTLTPAGHLGFEFAAWYWHFVDVVWLFLFIFVYVWGR